MLHLYSYYRSSAAYRVRIALALKQLNYTLHPIHLLNHGGEQHQASYQELNPQELVPTLIDGEQVITQSLAIIDYLDQQYTTTLPLIPQDHILRAKVWSMALTIACDIHPLNNLRVLKYLKKDCALVDEQKSQWIQHWIVLGFSALEKQLSTEFAHTTYCFGETPSLADCCLIPQIYNAKRFGVSMEPFPRLTTIENHCLNLAAFQKASPEQQPDYQAS